MQNKYKLLGYEDNLQKCFKALWKHYKSFSRLTYFSAAQDTNMRYSNTHVNLMRECPFIANIAW